MASLSPISGNLGAKRAAHLLRRTSFNFTKSRVDSLANKTASSAVSQLLVQNPLVNAQPWYVPTATPTAPAATFCLPYTTALVDQDFMYRPYVMGWWAHEAMVDNAIGHKMELFLHQNGTVNASTFGMQYFYDHLMLLRAHALGNYKKFAMKLVTDNTMLLYLNNNSNSAANPNENFAREFFELFTIGKGPEIAAGNYTNYTEDDIVAAARLLTGFRVTYRSGYATSLDPDTGILRGYAKIACIDSETQPDIGINRIKALILQGIGAQFVDQANAPPFLPQVEEDTPATVCDFLQRCIQLRATIAFEAAQHITGQTFAVQTDQRRATVGRSDHQRDMLSSRFGGSKGSNLGFLRHIHWQPRAGDELQAPCIFVRLYVAPRNLLCTAIAIVHKESRQQPGYARQFERGGCADVCCAHRNTAKRPFERRCKIEGRISQRAGHGEIKPGLTCNAHRLSRRRGICLIGEFERGGTRCRHQHIARPAKGSKPRIVGRFNREDRDRPIDCHRPTTPERVHCPCRCPRVGHTRNSVMSGI